jgi:hypothetical protein
MKEKEETNPFSQFANCYFVAYERKSSPRYGQYATNLFKPAPPQATLRAATCTHSHHASVHYGERKKTSKWDSSITGIWLLVMGYVCWKQIKFKNLKLKIEKLKSKNRNRKSKQKIFQKSANEKWKSEITK